MDGKIVEANDANLSSFDIENTLTKSENGIINSRDEITDQKIRKRNSKRDPFSSDLQLVTSAVKDHKDSEKRAAECRIAAAIVDRAFMVLFVLVFFLSAMIILILPFINK